MSLSQLYPTIRPTLLLDFAAAGVLDPRVTFTRSTTAVYYDGSTYSLAEQNLLLQSQAISVAPWTELRTAPSVLNAATAPDGTVTATKIIANTANNYHVVYQVVNTVTNVYVVSVYAKPAEYTKFCLADPNTSRFVVTFDLVAGTVLSTGGSRLVSATATLDAVTGWTRCTVTIDVNSANIYVGMMGYPDSGATVGAFGASYIGDNTSGVYVWGAQFEQRNSVTAYTATTTVGITNYIPVLVTAPAGVARFDHNPVTEVSLGLLIEEARTNLKTYSQEFTGAGIWANNSGASTNNVTVAPDGTLTSGIIVPDVGTVLNSNGNTFYSRSGAITVSNTTAYTFSLYLKASIYPVVDLKISAQTNLVSGIANAQFNLSTGTIVSTTTGTSSITSVGNGWYRCTVTGTTATTTVYAGITVGGGATADGFNGIYMWGAQLEAGAFPTTYIATTAATATRTADSAVMTGTNFSIWYNSGEGALYQNFTALGVSLTDRVSLRISDTASTFVNDITFRNYNGTEVFAVHVGGLPAQVSLYSPITVTAGSVNRVAAVYKPNDFAFSMNQGTATTNSSGTIPIVSQLSFPSSGCNYIRKVAYYPARLTNAQLQALT